MLNQNSQQENSIVEFNTVGADQQMNGSPQKGAMLTGQQNQHENLEGLKKEAGMVPDQEEQA